MHGAKSGYLVKESIRGHILSKPRRRFFFLSDGQLEWYEPKGSMRLAGANINEGLDTLSIISAGEHLVLRGDDLDAWAEAIRMQLDDRVLPCPSAPGTSSAQLGPPPSKPQPQANDLNVATTTPAHQLAACHLIAEPQCCRAAAESTAVHVWRASQRCVSCPCAIALR